MHPRSETKALIVLLLTLCISPCLQICLGGERIDILVVGRYLDLLRPYFDPEPLVSYRGIPFRIVDSSAEDAIKMLRLYFPRTYQEIKKYDVIMLNSPEYQLFSPIQDQWMHNAIQDGMGGINAGSVFSIIAEIHWAWANSQTSRAFPNDALAVANKGGGGETSMAFLVVVNRAFRDPVLLPYLAFGVESVGCYASSRLVLAREGAGVLAWQVGNHPGGRVDYLIAWDYGEGRTMTCGNVLPKGWFEWKENEYGADMLMNMILYMAKKNLIQDVMLFHELKSGFVEFRSKMLGLISLRDFVDRFGANTNSIQEEVLRLNGLYQEGVDLYLAQDFQGCKDAVDSALRQFSAAEDLARRVKDSALLWVYVIEWFITSSTLFISGFILWTLMVRRKMYREVEATRLG